MRRTTIGKVLRKIYLHLGKSFDFIFPWSETIQVNLSRSKLIRPGLAVRVDPVRLLYLPLFNPLSAQHKIDIWLTPLLTLNHRHATMCSLIHVYELVIMRVLTFDCMLSKCPLSVYRVSNQMSFLCWLRSWTIVELINHTTAVQVIFLSIYCRL